MPTEDQEAESVLDGLGGIEMVCGCGVTKTISRGGLAWTCECGTFWWVTDKDVRFTTRRYSPNETSTRGHGAS